MQKMELQTSHTIYVYKTDTTCNYQRHTCSEHGKSHPIPDNGYSIHSSYIDRLLYTTNILECNAKPYNPSLDNSIF